jgi:hypothetical protein
MNAVQIDGNTIHGITKEEWEQNQLHILYPRSRHDKPGIFFFRVKNVLWGAYAYKVRLPKEPCPFEQYYILDVLYEDHPRTPSVSEFYFRRVL